MNNNVEDTTNNLGAPKSSPRVKSDLGSGLGILHWELYDPSVEPTPEDVEELARRIGIDPRTEEGLLSIARDGLKEKLPENWRPCLDPTKNRWYYFNTETKESTWEHPMNEIYRQKVAQARSENALNRIQTFDPSRAKPPSKSLPPLKKLGAGVPLGNGVTLGPVTSFAGGGASQNRANLPSSNQNPIPATRTTSTIGGGGGDWRNERLIEEIPESPPNFPQPAQRVSPIENKPPMRRGLTLTGSGASFLKSSTPSTAPSTAKEEFEPEAPESQPKPSITPIKSSLKNSNPSSNGSSSTSLNANSIKSLRSDGRNSEWNIDAKRLEGDEKKVWESLEKSLEDSIRKPNVKFKLDENSEIRFEKDEEEEEDDEEEETAESVDSQDENNQPTLSLGQIPHFPLPKNKVIQSNGVKPASAPQPMAPMQFKSPNKIEFGSTLMSKSEPANLTNFNKINEKEEIIRTVSDKRLKKFEADLEKSRIEREANMKKQTEETLDNLRRANEERVKQFKLELTQKQQEEIENERRDMKQKLMEESEKMSKEFKARIAQKRAELIRDYDKSINDLSEELESSNKERRRLLMAERISEESRSLEKELEEEAKKTKAGMKIEQQKQIQQMRDYHQTFIQKLKEEFKTEIESLRRSHEREMASLSSKFASEKAELMARLKAENEVEEMNQSKESNRRRLEYSKSRQSVLEEPEVDPEMPQIPKPLFQKSSKSPRKSASSELPPKLPPESTVKGNELEEVKGKLNKIEEQYSGLKKELEEVVAAEIQRKLAKFGLSLPNLVGLQSGENSTAGEPLNSIGDEEVNEEDGSNMTFSILSQNLNIEEMMRGNDDRLNQALQSLDTLRGQIVHLKSDKKDQSKQKKSASSPPKIPNKKRTEIPDKNTSNLTLGVGRKNREKIIAECRGQRSLKSMVNTPSHMEASEDYVEEAKNFIKSQKHRLNQFSVGSGSKARRNYGEMYSETESSGLGSLVIGKGGHKMRFDPKYSNLSLQNPNSDMVEHTEEDSRSETSQGQINQDIDSILNSLKKLDGQMKYLWGVVEGNPPKSNQVQNIQPAPEFQNLSRSSFALNSFTQSQLQHGQSSRTLFTATSSPNLANIIDLNERRSQERFLGMFGLRNNQRGFGELQMQELSLSEKTKNLREWLDRI